MGEIWELVKKHEALKLAKEVARAKQDTTKEIGVVEATTIVAEQYKKAQSLAAKQGKEHNKITNAILTDKVNIDNGDLYFDGVGDTIGEL